MKLVVKGDWGAHPSPRVPKYKWDTIVIHHSGDSRDVLTDFFKGYDEGFMLRLQEIHLNQGWADIGYNFGIGPEGAIMQGRALTINGAHAKGVNYRSIGICVLGNCDLREPTEAQMRSLKELVKWLRFIYGISGKRVLGHRDVNSTACPGKHLYARLNELRD